MTRNNKFALLSVAAFLISLAAVPARAQGANGQIIVKATTAPAPSPKPNKARFEVLHMMINAIQVRSLVDSREIHTFIYSDQIRSRMQAMFNGGAYQYGDKIEIYFTPGSDVALNIKGKPSKPI